MDEGRSEPQPALPASPTGRVPQLVVDEALGVRTPQDGWRSWSPAAEQRAGRRPRLRTVLAVLLVLGVGLGAAAVVRPDLLVLPPVAAGPGLLHPTPGHEAADAPLGVPIAAPPSGGTHAFVAQQPGSEEPVAYDPCRPVHYVIRPDHAPIGGERLVHDAFERVSFVTGLQFVYDGATVEQPSREREPYQPDRYGDRWAPVVVAWQTEEENPTFASDVAGEAGSQSFSIGGGPRVYVTGEVALDAAAFEQMLGDPAGFGVARAIVLHEIGHLVGLDHVADPSQLMHPSTSTVLDFAHGDLTGLVALGQGACVPGL